MIIDILLIAVFVICIILNTKRGFVKSALGVLSFALALVIALNCSGEFCDFLKDTQSGKAAQSKIYNMTYERLFEAQTEGKQKVGEAINLPPFIENKIESWQISGKTYAAVSENVSAAVFDVLAKVLLFIILSIVFYIARLVAPHIFKLPVLKQANGVLGALFGAVNGVIFVYIIMFVLYVLQSFNNSDMLTQLLNASKIYALAF